MANHNAPEYLKLFSLDEQVRRRFARGCPRDRTRKEANADLNFLTNVQLLGLMSDALDDLFGVSR